MNGRVRRTRFQERVRLEREFLAPVNRRFGADAPLAGMTGDAIDSWERRAIRLNSAADVRRIARLLREVALRAELLADNSRDVFEANRKVGPDGLAEIAKMLKEELGR